jgi:hypothetical protein
VGALIRVDYHLIRSSFGGHALHERNFETQMLSSLRAVSKLFPSVELFRYHQRRCCPSYLEQMDAMSLAQISTVLRKHLTRIPIITLQSGDTFFITRSDRIFHFIDSTAFERETREACRRRSRKLSAEKQ